MEYLQPYAPIGMVFVLALGFASVTIIAGRILGPRRANPSKHEPYESGMEPVGEANIRMPVKFYMVGLIFLIFDVEAVFLLIWAVTLRGTGIDFASPAIAFEQVAFTRFAFLEMTTFITILLIGYFYVWRKGGLEWN